MLAQFKDDYIKRDWTKHISPKILLTHDLPKYDDISIQQICSSDNLLDFFSKLLPNRIFNQLVRKIGLHHRKNDHSVEGEKWFFLKKYCTIFSSLDFFPLDFSSKILTRHILNKHPRRLLWIMDVCLHIIFPLLFVIICID